LPPVSDAGAATHPASQLLSYFALVTGETRTNIFESAKFRSIIE
jgi:hypothetical protein